VNAYWRLAAIVRRAMPDAWVRKWAHEHLRASGACIAYPDAGDFTLMVLRPVRVEFPSNDGVVERIDAVPGDTINVALSKGQAGFNVYRRLQSVRGNVLH